MPNEWNLHADEIFGPESGKNLSGGIVRLSADGKSYEFLAVVATAQPKDPQDTMDFPPFAYNGLIWNVSVTPPYDPGQESITGGWGNNKRHGPPAEDEGTYTGQGSSGTPEECKEDAASASA